MAYRYPTEIRHFSQSEQLNSGSLLLVAGVRQTLS